MRRSKKRAGSRGLVLVEIVIAVAILGLIGTLTYGVFGRVEQGRERATQISQHYHQVRQAMLRMARELQVAFVSIHRDCDDPRTNTIFKTSRRGSGMRLDFTAFAHFKTRADANESDQLEIAYFVAPNPDTKEGTALIRRSQTRLDDDPEEGGREQVLAENVTSLEFEFYDEREDDWESEWDSTNTDFRDRLPMFVSIRMKVKNPAGEEEEFVTKTRIHLRQSIQSFGLGFTRCVD